MSQSEDSVTTPRPPVVNNRGLSQGFIKAVILLGFILAVLVGLVFGIMAISITPFH